MAVEHKTQDSASGLITPPSSPVPIAAFTFVSNPARIIFGSGSRARIPTEVDLLKAKRVLLVSTPEQEGMARSVAEPLGDRLVATFPGAMMHTPVEVTERAMEMVRAVHADAILAVGGGSTIGLSKAIAVRTDLPQLVLPTTYAGSEVTPVVGETADGQKTTRSSPSIRPETVIYDVDLTLSLPPMLSCTSGINAMAHAIEALYSPDANPIVWLMAEEAVSAIAKSLPAILERADDVDARSQALYGAWLAGTCLGSVGMALHHKLCHVLGGSFGLPHSETHTVVLPHALAYNAGHAPDAVARLSRALGAQDPAAAIFDLTGKLGVARSLRDLGMKESDLAVAADLAFANAYSNPRPLERDTLLALLREAWNGDAPAPLRIQSTAAPAGKAFSGAIA